MPDADLLTQAPEDVAAAITTMMQQHQIPGLSLVVVNPDRLLFAGSAGTADPTTGAPATITTQYLWFSMTKLVTATAALRLADEGRLDLDAPVAGYLDYLRAPGSRHPTVRDLLGHTSGLANPVPIRWAHAADAAPPDPEALLRRLLGQSRAYRHPVGGPPRYSNVGYLALGQIITAVANRPFQAYVRRAVLDPAGMVRTDFTHRDDADVAVGSLRVPRVADPVLRRLLPPGVAGTRRGRTLTLSRFYVDGPAYGGLVGDVLEAGRFLRLHLNDGELDGVRILAADTARRMRSLTPGKPRDHGLGWIRSPGPGRGSWVEHFGAGVGFCNVMRLYPERGLGIVVMTNSTRRYDFEPLFNLLEETSWS